MKLLILCNEGLEPFVEKELKKQHQKNSAEKQDEGCVIAKVHDEKEAIRFIYTTRFASSMHMLLSTFKHPEDFEELENSCKEQSKSWQLQKIEKSWTVKAAHSAGCPFTSQELGEAVRTACKAREEITGPFTFKNPTTEIRVYGTAENTYIGITLTLHPLGRRQYRVFHGRDALKGQTAAALLDILEWKNSKTLLDPFAQSGTIAIEAIMASRCMPVRFFEKQKLIASMPENIKVHAEAVFAEEDKKQEQGIKKFTSHVMAFDDSFPRIRSAQKNARLADVHKLIQFSRQSVDWIDIKCEKNSLDCIATSPDYLQARNDEMLFARAEKVLKKGGLFGIVTRNPLRWKRKTALILKEEHVIHQGKEPWVVLIYEKKDEKKVVKTKKKNNKNE